MAAPGRETRRRAWRRGIHAWSSAGGREVLFGAEDGVEEQKEEEKEADFTEEI